MPQKDRVQTLYDVFDTYFDYVGISESPRIFHRWCFLTGVAALIGRKTHIPFGHLKLYANMYTILIGAAGTRKSTAISQTKGLLRSVGFKNFAADRTSKEKFIADLQALNDRPEDFDTFLDMEVMDAEKHPAEMLIAADELQDFMGQNNIDFMSMLGVLWDCKDEYEHRVKHGKNSLVYNPYICMLGGSTQTGFALAFPPEIVTQGFLSRLLLIYGERTPRRIAWPSMASDAADSLTERLSIIRETPRKALNVSEDARAIASKIYATEYSLRDARFESYEQRRYTHMLKLALILSQLRLDDTVHKEDMLVANTILHEAEKKMPYALGEFGKSKYADVATIILDALQRADKPLTLTEIWKIVANDLPSQKDLIDILRGLQAVEKIQTISTTSGMAYTTKHLSISFDNEAYLVKDFIPAEELSYDI